MRKFAIIVAMFLFPASFASGQTAPVPLLSPVFEAIRGKDPDALKRLLSDRSLASAKDGDGQTPLGFAARVGDLQGVEILLAAGVAVDEPGASATPLLYAAGAGHLEIVKLLVEKGADVQAVKNDGEGGVLLALQAYYAPSCGTPSQMDVVNYLVDKGALLGVHEAAALGRVDRLKGLLEGDSKLGDKKCAMGRTPLMWAAIFDQVEAARLLIDRGADINISGNDTSNMIDEWGKSALHMAIEHKSMKVLALLLEKGANVNGDKDAYYTPLMLAVKNGDKTTAEKLLSLGAEINALPANSSTTALAIAFDQKSAEMIGLLLDHKADPNRGSGTNAGTLLHRAVEGGDEAMIRQLLGAGASLTGVDDKGFTPLHTAAHMEDSQGIVRLLLGVGGNPDQTSRPGWTPLHVAASAGQTASVQLLLGAHAHINAVDEVGWAPLHWAIWHQHPQVVEMLLAHGANPSLVTREKLTPLSLAMYRRDSALADRLLAAGAKLDVPTAVGLGRVEPLRELLAGPQKDSANAVEPFGGKTALQWAAIVGSADCVRVLLAAGAKVNAADATGMTPLHEAALFDHLEAVNVLLAAGADANAQDAWGFTPWAVARDQGVDAIAKRLVDAGAKPISPGEVLLARLQPAIDGLAWERLADLQKTAMEARQKKDQAASRPSVDDLNLEMNQLFDKAYTQMRDRLVFRTHADDNIWGFFFYPPAEFFDRRQRELLAPEALSLMRGEILTDRVAFGQSYDSSPDNPVEFSFQQLALLELLGDSDARRDVQRIMDSSNPLFVYHGILQRLRQVWWLSRHDAVAQSHVLDLLRTIAARAPDSLKHREQLSMTGSALLHSAPATPELAAALVVFVRKDAGDAALAREMETDARSIIAQMQLLDHPLDFTGATLDGAAFDVAALRGRVVVVDFWATWCGPCVASLPKLEALHETLGESVAIVGVSSDESPDALRAFLAAHPRMSWPQLYSSNSGSQHPLNARFGIDGIPRVFLIDKKGVLRSLDAGNDLEQKIRRLMAE